MKNSKNVLNDQIMFEVLQKPSCIVDKHPDFNPILKLVWLWMQKEKKTKNNTKLKVTVWAVANGAVHRPECLFPQFDLGEETSRWRAAESLGRKRNILWARFWFNHSHNESTRTGAPLSSSMYFLGVCMMLRKTLIGKKTKKWHMACWCSLFCG